MVYTTIRVKKTTLARLSAIVAELSAKFRRRISYDEAINYLINIYNSKRKLELDEATQELIKMIRISFPGAGPEDFREYDYGDL